MDGCADDTKLSPDRLLLVGDLARSALSQLAETPRNAPLERVGQALYRAALAPQPLDPRQILAHPALRSVPRHLIHDQAIGAVAQRLGEDWIADRLGFADVARASSWLYGLSKEIGQDWQDRTGLQRPATARRILLATTEGESHLLGPVILAQKLRRAGHSVRLCNNASPDRLAALLTGDPCDGLMLSVSTGRGLVNAGQVVTRIRQGVSAQIPIVLGGAVLDFCEAEAAEIGADLVTKDVNTGLNALGAGQRPGCAGAAE